MKQVFISVNEFCALFGVGRTKTYELLNSGQIQKAKIGKSTFITVESAEAFAARAIMKAKNMS